MKHDTCFKKFNLTKNGFILLIVAISLLMLNGKAFSADSNGSYPLTIVNDSFLKPLKNLKYAIDLVNLKYQDTFNDESEGDEVEAQALRNDFKWVFEAEGLSLVESTINQEDGTVLTATTNLDIEIELKNLDNDESVIRTGGLQSNLFALKPNPLLNRGKEEWVTEIDGVIIFPPVSSNGDAFVMSIDGNVNFDALGEGLEGLEDLEDFLNNLEDLAGVGNDLLNNILIKLTAVGIDGQQKWNTPVEFSRTLPVGRPVGAPGLILATTVKIPDLSNASSGIGNIVKDFTGIVSAFNVDTGEEEWSFDPAEIGGDSKLFVINPPIVNDDTIYVNAISFISEEDINEFIELIGTTITDIQTAIETTITDSISQLLIAILVGGDIQPIVDDITEEIESLINDSINSITDGIPDLSSKLFALDLEGNAIWDSEFEGISGTSPIATDSGINVNGTNVTLGDVSFTADIVAELTPEGILNIDADINLIIAGADINVGMVLSLDITSADPLSTLNTELDLPDLSDVLNSLDVFEGALTTFDVIDGELKWQTMINEHILFEPVTSGDQIIAVANGYNTDNVAEDISDLLEQIITNPISKVYSIDTANGGINWTSEQIDGTIVSSALLGPDNDVYLTYLDEGRMQIHALNPNDGSEKWANPFKPDNLVTSTPIINPNDGMVFLSTSKLDDLQNPETDDGRTKIRDLIPDATGEVLGLDPSTGVVEKTIEVDGFPFVSPTIDNNENTIYSTTSDFDLDGLKGIDLLTFVHAYDLE